MSWLTSAMSKKSPPSGKDAADRLGIILVTDRLSNPEHLKKRIKAEIIKAISPFLHIDPANFEVHICAPDPVNETPMVHAEFPLPRPKTQQG